MRAISEAMQQLAEGNLDIPGYETFQGDFLPVQESLLIVINSLNDTMSEINMLVDGTDKMISKINQIAEASKKQAAATEMVSAGINQISDVVQTNSATAEESAAACEELYGQSQLLKNRVSRFKLHANK